MPDLDQVRMLLSRYTSLEGAKAFFKGLGYPVMDSLPLDLDVVAGASRRAAPASVREAVRSIVQLVHIGDRSSFRVFHVERVGAGHAVPLPFQRRESNHVLRPGKAPSM